MNQFFSYIALITVVLLSSCKNELDVLAPGKEMVSVYAVLNPNTSVQNIRINKVFVTTGDANVAATEEKSVNYNAGELIVTLERYVNGNKDYTTKNNTSKKEIVLTETVVTTTNGAFSNQQRIWQTSDRLIPSGEYKLIIKKAADNTEIASARTIMIDSVSTSATASNSNPFSYLPNNPTAYPMHPLPEPLNTTDKPKYLDWSNLIQNKTIPIKSVSGGKLYTMLIRLHYTDTLLNNSTVSQFIDMSLSQAVVKKLDGSEVIQDFKLNPIKEFYNNISLEMQKKGNTNIKKRKIEYISILVSVATDNLYTFLQVNAPSTSIAQDKPYYTNITNGVGVFACTSTSYVSKDLWSTFIDEIACNLITKPYLFCKFSTGNPC